MMNQQNMRQWVRRNFHSKVFKSSNQHVNKTVNTSRETQKNVKSKTFYSSNNQFQSHDDQNQMHNAWLLNTWEESNPAKTFHRSKPTKVVNNIASTQQIKTQNTSKIHNQVLIAEEQITKATKIAEKVLALQYCREIFREWGSSQNLSYADTTFATSLFFTVMQELQQQPHQNFALHQPVLFSNTIMAFPLISIMQTSLEYGDIPRAIAIVDALSNFLTTRTDTSGITVFNNTLNELLGVVTQADIQYDMEPFQVRSMSMQILDVLRKISKYASNPYDTYRYQVVMAMLVRHFDATGVATINQAVALFEEALAAGFIPTRATWSVALSASSRLESPEIAFHYLNLLINNGTPPHVGLANAMIEGFRRTGKIVAAETILDNMRFQVAWKPDTFFNPSIVSTTLESLRIDFEQNPLYNSSIASSSSSLPSSSSSSAQKGKHDDFRVRVEPKGWVAPGSDASSNVTSGKWPSPTAFSYNRVMKAYSEQNDIDRVYELYVDMKRRGVPCDDATISIVTDTFKDSHYAFELLRMEQPQLVPLPTSFVNDKMLERGIFTKPKSNFLDLHNLSRGQARITVMAHLEALANAIWALEKQLHDSDRQQGSDAIKEVLKRFELNRLVIITGKGMNTAGGGGPVLKGHIEALLSSKNVKFFSPTYNAGRTVVPLENLIPYAQQSRAEQEQVHRHSNHTFWGLGIAFAVGSGSFLFFGGVPDVLSS